LINVNNICPSDSSPQAIASVLSGLDVRVTVVEGKVYVLAEQVCKGDLPFSKELSGKSSPFCHPRWVMICNLDCNTLLPENRYALLAAGLL